MVAGMLAERGRHRRLGVPRAQSSPIWIVAVLFFVQGAGLGLAIPAATFGVMEALPRERAGAGLRADQHRPPGRGGAQRRGARLDPLAGLPQLARPRPCRALPAAAAERGGLVHHRHPGGRGAARPRRPVPAGPGGLRLRGRDADHHRRSRRPSPSSAASRCSRWMPGRKRPTIEEIEELVAAEVAAAERDLAAGLRSGAELSEPVDAGRQAGPVETSGRTTDRERRRVPAMRAHDSRVAAT